MRSHRILLAAGSNAKGQLGVGSFDDAHTFTPCQFAGCEPDRLPDLTSRVADVACGANHTVLLLEHLDGSTTLWGAGDGSKGQLGPGCGGRGKFKKEPDPGAPWATIFRKLDLQLPPQYGAAADAVSVGDGDSRGYACTRVAAAWETTYVVLSGPKGCSDVLLSVGSNDFGALGANEEGAGSKRTAVDAELVRVVDLNHVFSDDSGRRSLPRTIRVRSLRAGPRHVIAELAEEDSAHRQTVLVGWGASRHGQLGQNGGARFFARPTPLPIDIQGDAMVSCALGNQHTVVLHESGRISALGSNKQGQIPSLGSEQRVCRLGCTWNGTYMQIIDDHRQVLHSTGNNAQGQLGRGHAKGSSSAVDLLVDRAASNFVCGSEHVLVAVSEFAQKGNLVLGWGWNEHGNMGLGSLGNITIPTQLWPRENTEAYNKYPERVIGIWAGCATSWLLVE